MTEIMTDLELSIDIDNELLLQETAEPVEIECLTIEEWLTL